MLIVGGVFYFVIFVWILYDSRQPQREWTGGWKDHAEPVVYFLALLGLVAWGGWEFYSSVNARLLTSKTTKEVHLIWIGLLGLLYGAWAMCRRWSETTWRWPWKWGTKATWFVIGAFTMLAVLAGIATVYEMIADASTIH